MRASFFGLILCAEIQIYTWKQNVHFTTLPRAHVFLNPLHAHFQEHTHQRSSSLNSMALSVCSPRVLWLPLEVHRCRRAQGNVTASQIFNFLQSEFVITTHWGVEHGGDPNIQQEVSTSVVSSGPGKMVQGSHSIVTSSQYCIKSSSSSHRGCKL